MADILYQANLTITGVTDFGVPLQQALAGDIPPQGARIDVAFEGPVRGLLEGTLKGVDYLRFRADGRAELDLHGVITLTDGRRLAWSAEGLALPRAGAPIVDITELIRVDSAHRDLTWTHTRAITAQGEVNLATGTITVTAYA